MTLRQYLVHRAQQGFTEQSEGRMLGTAAQLMEASAFSLLFTVPHILPLLWQLLLLVMQTLHGLHECANLAHFDVTEGNISLTPNTNNKWYTLGLFDFGLSQPLVPGKGGNRAQPLGVTLIAASPEVLLAHQEWEQHWVELAEVDGVAADMWSAGTLLYAMLTGVDPFDIHAEKQYEPHWLRFQIARTAQYSWAEMEGVPVSHPLLDRVRTCSTTPDAAANFFTAVLHPCPTKRLTSAQALQHPYLRHCVLQMLEAQATQVPAPAPAQGSCCMSTESHSLACAPLPASNASRLSVLSRLFPRKVDPLSQYFPDYTQASSDAELTCVPVSCADKLLTQFQQSMDQLHQASIKEVYSHPIDILPEDEEETAVAGTAPGLRQPSLQLCSANAKNSDHPRMAGQQAVGPGASITCSIIADAATHAMAPENASAWQTGSLGLTSGMACLEAPYHAKPPPPRIKPTPKRERKRWVQRCGGALAKLGNAQVLAAAAAAAAGVCITLSRRS
ncbi:hypothetical protein ABBQ38_009876 [Trebouxia sp. C0009 RCD-2024]